MDVKNSTDGWIETYTGKKFWFDNPTVDMIDIVDIAHSLAMQCRYSGHCLKFYSVAEHSCILHDYYLAFKGFTQDSNERALELLLHDASEAYLTDVPRPIKPYIPEYVTMEKKIEKAIAQKFGTQYPHAPEVKELDTRILLDEKTQNMPESINDWNIQFPPLDVQLRFWNPTRAESEFLGRFNQRMMKNVAA